ncbi:hypothetical protein [Alicyclobacillus shizuokensis]|uniref:hypothetical protein n=1 Tax=Alicyclobacillus shizuokensis TaxID=392014 RepID=UPI0008302BEE|nr:hypothetical protein [Alicyclobacillus shizuokensis]
MPRFLQALIATPAFVQLVLASIKLVESPKNGQAKKKAVLDIVSAVYDELAANFRIRFGKTFVLRVADLVIEIGVRFYNLIGEFKHNHDNKDEATSDDSASQAPKAEAPKDAKAPAEPTTAPAAPATSPEPAAPAEPADQPANPAEGNAEPSENQSVAANPTQPVSQ